MSGLHEVEDRMTFAAFDRCRCGAGLAYDPLSGPDEGTPFNIPSLWHCSDTLLYPFETPERRATIVAAIHDRPVDMSMGAIRGERQDRGTTRSDASQHRRAIAAGTRSAETRSKAPSEGCQSGPKGDGA